MISRSELKTQIQTDKFNRCDVCGKPAHDLHEIFFRNLTDPDSEARQLSYAKELCALLCRDCHDKAHNDTWGDALLQLNYWHYGWEAVEKAYAALTTHISVRTLPPIDPDIMKIRLKLLKDK